MYDKTVRRRRAVLGLLVAGSLILLTAYFGESAGGGLHSVQRGVVEVVSPIQEGASRALKPVRDLIGWVGDTIDAKGEVKQLRSERDALREQAVTGAAAAARERPAARPAEPRQVAGARRTRRRSRRASSARTRASGASQVHHRQGHERRRPAQPARDQPPRAWSGVVTTAASNSAIVTLLTDHRTAVGARVAESGVGGVIEVEAGRPNDLVMRFTTRNDEVTPGQNVITAGTQSRTDRVTSLYPPRIPIGRVTRVDDPGDRRPARPHPPVRRHAPPRLRPGA